MSSFHISDITFAGTYASAAKAAQDSDRKNAARHSETGKCSNVLKSLKSLVRRIVATAAIKKRPAASQLTSRPV